CISSTYYIFVYTDSLNQVFEYAPDYDAEANNASLTPAQVKISSTPPDLQVTSVVPNVTTGTAGQSLAVTWTVANKGTGPTIEGSWNDTVYLSSATTFDASSAVAVGTFTHTGDLNAGANYTRTENITLPLTAQGTYTIFVQTDSGNQVNE